MQQDVTRCGSCVIQQTWSRLLDSQTRRRVLTRNLQHIPTKTCSLRQNFVYERNLQPHERFYGEWCANGSPAAVSVCTHNTRGKWASGRSPKWCMYIWAIINVISIGKHCNVLIKMNKVRIEAKICRWKGLTGTWKVLWWAMRHRFPGPVCTRTIRKKRASGQSLK